MKSKLAKQVFHLSSRKNTQTFLFAKVYPCLFWGIKSSKILLTLNTKTSLFCSVIKSSPILLSSLIFLLVFSCETDKTPISTIQVKITLSAEYVAVTEAWLKVELENSPENVQVKLWRDTTIVFNGRFSGTDTTVLDTNLLPAHNYTYHSAIMEENKPLVTSPPLKMTTIDTTSHNFTWEILEIPSPYGSGVLRDVTIINENEIWAVGEIYSDSTQPWVPYNAVHWDGQNWEFMRIPFIGPCSAVDFPPIIAIWAYSENQILFTNGGAIAIYNGKHTQLDCGMNSLLNGAIKKIFVTDSSNIYAVGANGTVVSYDAQVWHKLESGTELPIQDIWGALDKKSKEYHILSVASLKYNFAVPQLLRINEGAVSKQFLTIYNRLHGIWFKTPYKIYLCGGGVYNGIYGKWQEEPGLPAIFTNRIRGSDLNNIWVVGDFGIVLHFNGISWKQLSALWLGNGNYEGLAVKENLAVAVGWKGGVALIVKIKISK